MTKSQILVIIISMVGLLKIQSQSVSKWYPLEAMLDIEGTWCVYSSTNSDSTTSSLFKAQMEFVKDPVVSNYKIIDNDSIGHPLHDNIYGMRGTIDNKEVLIIDSDMDLSLADEKVIILPTIERDESFPYHEDYLFPSKINYNFNLTYDNLINNQIHQKNTNLGVTVSHKSDTINNTLYYIDKFKICFNQKLMFQGYLDGLKVEISCFDYFPWWTKFQFTLNSKNDKNKTVGIKTPFKLQEDGKLYQIDSVDFINNKMLINSQVNKDQFYVEGESLFSEELINTDSSSNEIKIVHVWGSWCLPCVKNLPKLVKLNELHPQIKIMGICKDKSKDTALRVTDKLGINWENIYFNINDESALDDLNIISYPTYLIVQNNIIQERYHSVEDIENYLSHVH